MVKPPAVGNVAKLVNFAVVESAKTYSVIIATVGVAVLCARQVQIASTVSACAIFQARPPVMDNVVRLACWVAAVTRVPTFKTMETIVEDVAILVLVPWSVLKGVARNEGRMKALVSKLLRESYGCR
ncbi:uncharacterized protein CDV56_105761 [Aspergillus thermomutatus]|uniref:Uncharacterized protein n=1 Tax=Aspergillus thermomutatus TaxID=41047 RepID=A0A397GGC6_ASPTH|nr:uncharacterized protein CDV56_105761 [Aspergillus thermomutatus]RHZ49189.1 hypothetical protein CDV56_105761 [Aspergillus thermomutatus]